MNDMLKKAIEIANKKYDGHFTLMKFTTNWRFCFGTVLEPLMQTQYMANGKTMEDAIEQGIERNISAYDFPEDFRS